MSSPISVWPLQAFFAKNSQKANTKKPFRFWPSYFSFFPGNVMSILVLFRKDMDLKPNFMQILVTLIAFDILCIIFNWSIFGLPLICSSYYDHVFPYIVPYILPLAQIALTGKPFLLFFARYRVSQQVLVC